MPVIRGWDASEYVADADLLLEKGNVAWAAVVMANNRLFENREGGNPDAPGVVVFCPDQRSSITTEGLLGIARQVFQLYRDGTDDPELKELAELLKQDTRPMKGYIVPARLSPVYRCQVSSVLYKRDHFPQQTLEGDLVPILHHAQGNGIVRMVPSRFWPEAMVDEWKREAKEAQPKRSLFSRFAAVPAVILLIKLAIFCLAMLWLAPSTWTFIRQSEPLPEVEVSGLSQMREGTIFRFTGELDEGRKLEVKKKAYLPVEGTEGKVWAVHRSYNGAPPSAVEKQVSVLEQSSWLDSDLQKHIAKTSPAGATWPVLILKSTAAPTMGMKIYRVSLIAISLLVLWLIGSWLLRAIRS
jgi:hypothetical protein